MKNDFYFASISIVVGFYVGVAGYRTDCVLCVCDLAVSG